MNQHHTEQIRKTLGQILEFVIMLILAWLIAKYFVGPGCRPTMKSLVPKDPLGYIIVYTGFGIISIAVSCVLGLIPFHILKGIDWLCHFELETRISWERIWFIAICLIEIMSLFFFR